MHPFEKPPDRWTDDEARVLLKELVEPAVKTMKRRLMGPLLSEDEIIDAAIEALSDAAASYDPMREANPKTYYRTVARNAALRVRRYNRVRLEARCRLASLSQATITFDGGVCYDAPSPMELVELAREDERARQCLRECMDKLTDRMRTAVVRRFAVDPNRPWAEDLAKEQGFSKEYWRKASDDGLRKLVTLMRAVGFEVKERRGAADEQAAQSAG